MKQLSSQSLKQQQKAAMKDVATQDLRWSQRLRRLAGLAGLMVFILAALTMWQRGENLKPFWQYALPVIMGVVTFACVGLLVQYHDKEQVLKALPGIEYPFSWMRIQMGCYVFILIYVVGLYFLGLLAPETVFMRVLASWPLMIVFVVVLFLMTTGGGQVIINYGDDGITYRDTVSKSRLSRQDILYSLCGTWDDGIIIGWKCFPYRDMTSTRTEKDYLMIRGKSGDYNYILIIYTPRIRKMVDEAVYGKVEYSTVD